MTLTFDEAYEKLDSIVESALLDFEIELMQESAEYDEDYYLYEDGNGENPKVVNTMGRTQPETREQKKAKNDAEKAAAEAKLAGELSSRDLQATKHNISYQKRLDKSAERKAKLKEFTDKDGHPDDGRLKKIGRGIVRVIVAMFENLAKAFKWLWNKFANLGNGSFTIEAETIKGAISYGALSKYCNEANKFINAKVKTDKEGNKVEPASLKNAHDACFAVVRPGAMLSIAEIAKAMKYADDTSANFMIVAASLEDATGDAAETLKWKGDLLRKVGTELNKIRAAASELLASVNKKNTAKVDKIREKATKAGQSSAKNLYDKSTKNLNKLNDSVTVLLSQAQTLLDEGAVDDAYTLMATATELMEGSSDYVDGIGTDMGVDDLDQFDSEVDQDEYDPDVSGGEGQDPDDDIKEILGNDRVALALMTDDEGNQLVDEEVEIIL